MFSQVSSDGGNLFDHEVKVGGLNERIRARRFHNQKSFFIPVGEGDTRQDQLLTAELECLTEIEVFRRLADFCFYNDGVGLSVESFVDIGGVDYG